MPSIAPPGLTPIHRPTVFGNRHTLLPSAEEVELFSTTFQRHESPQSRERAQKLLLTNNSKRATSRTTFWTEIYALYMQEQRIRVLPCSHADATPVGRGAS